MANPILQKLAQAQASNPNGLGNALKMAAGLFSGMKGKDPGAMMRLVAAQNPTVKAALDLVQQNNGNAEAAFRALANENGIDPDEILSALRQAGIK